MAAILSPPQCVKDTILITATINVATRRNPGVGISKISNFSVRDISNFAKVDIKSFRPSDAYMRR